ncbi:MAG: hypothetical protein WB402_02480 [Sulfuricaulis sp.]|uniref:hypothetical protein n=1 Tax=Sulfuricaulis sp. TaxID=2003553 RepID=UPI003C430770
MKRTLIYSTVIAGLFSTVASITIAADKDRDQGDQPSQEQVYGSQLMNQQDRDDYRAQMSAAKTGQERDQIRQAHYKQMNERAKQQGVTLPDESPAHGMMPGMGSGGGMGGSGGGVGPGSRRMN